MIDTSQTLQYAHLKKRDDVALLLPSGSIGIELGVAEGELASRLLKAPMLRFLYGVDAYAGDRGHDIDQYKRVLRRLDCYRHRYSLLQMRFDQALDLFDDASFDFIYVDGYAHTGEEGGATFREWWPKLKPGGVFAGDDYDPAWPDVVRHVDAFLADQQLTGFVIPYVESETPYCKYPTWFTLKPA
ncbi:MAG TPA: class I SAM-dependent methyltransferase [Opitutus sp.]|nr:class I SAM-dependent methyltransferase [Opitutus sp.]